MGLCIDKNELPQIRVNVVMNRVPEELQRKMETEIKEFEKKAMDIVTASSKTMYDKALSGKLNEFDIVKFMKGLYVDKMQSTGIRLEIVLDGIPEEWQQKIEAEIKEFEKKARDIVTAVSETMSSKILSNINNC